jgi:hypothetical protein
MEISRFVDIGADQMGFRTGKETGFLGKILAGELEIPARNPVSRSPLPKCWTS